MIKAAVVIAFCAVCTVKAAMNLAGFAPQIEEQEDRR